MKNLLIIFLMFGLFNCDSDDRDTSVNNELLGEWKLISFNNEETGLSIATSDPDLYDPITNEEVNIILNFTDIENLMEGSTSRNTLSAIYNINNSMTVLIFLGTGISVTEVNETELGNLFFDSLALNFNPQTGNTENGFEMYGDIFRLYYSEFEYMTFERQ